MRKLGPRSFTRALGVLRLADVVTGRGARPVGGSGITTGLSRVQSALVVVLVCALVASGIPKDLTHFARSGEWPIHGGIAVAAGGATTTRVSLSSSGALLRGFVAGRRGRPWRTEHARLLAQGWDDG